MLNASAILQSAILPKEELEHLTNQLSRLLYSCGGNVSSFKVLMALASDTIVKNHVEINETLLSEDFINNDDFLKNVSFKFGKTLGITPSYAAYRGGTILPDKGLIIDDKGYMKAQLYVLQPSINLPCLFFDDNSSVMLSPLEMLEAKKIIPQLKGNILVDGVGLGHFLYHTSKEPFIESITVVENNLCLAHFFKKFILPQFQEYGLKIKIVEGEFYKFAEKEQLAPSYDHIVLINHQDSTKGIENHLLIEQLLFHKKEKLPVYFFYHHELYGYIQQFTYFISSLFLEKKLEEDVLSIGRQRLNPYLFIYYEYVCGLVYSPHTSITSISDINNLVKMGMDIKKLFSKKIQS